MVQSKRITLVEARKQGKLDEFIADHASDELGDADAFNRAVQAMARKSKEAPKSSAARSGDG